jgi:hypothetical protein
VDGTFTYFFSRYQLSAVSEVKSLARKSAAFLLPAGCETHLGLPPLAKQAGLITASGISGTWTVAVFGVDRQSIPTQEYR